MDIKAVTLFLSSQRIQPWQTLLLFYISKLIKNPFQPNRLFMSPLHHTPTLQPRLKFCFKQAKTSYFG